MTIVSALYLMRKLLDGFRLTAEFFNAVKPAETIVDFLCLFRIGAPQEWILRKKASSELLGIE